MKPWMILLTLAAVGPAWPAWQAGRPAPPTAPKKKSASPAPSPSKWPIASLQVEGNRNYTREQVLAVAGLRVGQPAGKVEFDAARDRLMASGAFETVGYRFEPATDRQAPNPQGYAATFQVTEAQPAYPLRFEDLGVPQQEIESVLAAKDP